MKWLQEEIRRFLRDEEGAHAVEYAVLTGLISIGFVGGAILLDGALNGFFTRVASCLGNPVQTIC